MDSARTEEGIARNIDFISEMYAMESIHGIDSNNIYDKEIGIVFLVEYLDEFCGIAVDEGTLRERISAAVDAKIRRNFTSHLN